MALVGDDFSWFFLVLLKAFNKKNLRKAKNKFFFFIICWPFLSCCFVFFFF